MRDSRHVIVLGEEIEGALPALVPSLEALGSSVVKAQTPGDLDSLLPETEPAPPRRTARETGNSPSSAALFWRAATTSARAGRERGLNIRAAPRNGNCWSVSRSASAGCPLSRAPRAERLPSRATS